MNPPLSPCASTNSNPWPQHSLPPVAQSGPFHTSKGRSKTPAPSLMRDTSNEEAAAVKLTAVGTLLVPCVCVCVCVLIVLVSFKELIIFP